MGKFRLWGKKDREYAIKQYYEKETARLGAEQPQMQREFDDIAKRHQCQLIVKLAYNPSGIIPVLGFEPIPYEQFEKNRPAGCLTEKPALHIVKKEANKNG